jgi:hypothetical protein
MSEIKITSHDQKGGITAQNVNVAQPAPPSPPDGPPEGRPKRPWYLSAWAIISALIIAVAAATEVLHYFGIAPWEKHS